MSPLEAFGQLFEHFYKKKKFASRYATVVSVDTSKGTCVVDVRNGAKGVVAKLSATLAESMQENSLIIYPAVGSIVMTDQVNDTRCVISMFSRISGIVIMDGTNGGVPISSSIVERLNRLENLLFSHQHLYVNTIGAPTPTLPDGATNAKLANTAVSDIENTKVKH